MYPKGICPTRQVLNTETLELDTLYHYNDDDHIIFYCIHENQKTLVSKQFSLIFTMCQIKLLCETIMILLLIVDKS